jgi:hypothetical protein
LEAGLLTQCSIQPSQGREQMEVPVLQGESCVNTPLRKLQIHPEKAGFFARALQNII